MNHRARNVVGLSVVAVWAVFQPTTATQDVPSVTEPIAVRSADADGLKMQYLAAGSGPAVVLLHGYAETSRMWRPLIPRLAPRFRVIAPDLPGIGGSGIPTDGLDMTHAAMRVHTLVKSLGVPKAVVVGHDIGLMVAYAYAAQFPAEVEKLVLMDAFLPGVEGWEAIYNNPGIWHFASTDPPPKRSFKGASARTSNISGTTSLPTRCARFLNPTAKPTPQHTRALDGCEPPGRISCRFKARRGTSHSSRRRN